MVMSQWEELGSILKKRRNILGISKEEVFEKVHITIETLEKIETGQFDSIPKIYAQEIIKRYLHILKLPEKEMLKKYISQLEVNDTEKVKIVKNKGKEKIKPLPFLVNVLVGIVSCIIFIQLFIIYDLNTKQKVQLINLGVENIDFVVGDKKYNLNKGKALSFDDDKKIVFNNNKGEIVVKYFGIKRSVFLNNFEVLFEDAKN